MQLKHKLQVFEHSALRIGESEGNVQFREHHFAQLVRYNEQHGNQFYTVGYKKIIFKNYVGVIQVNDLIIEILPKLEKEQNEKQLWQQVLLSMLCECHYIHVKSITEATLRLRSASLIELYFETFLTEVERLISQGLVKKYCQIQENCKIIRGKILFNENIRRNLFHKERFYIAKTVYDYQNIFNQIIKSALLCLEKMVLNISLANRVKQALLLMEEIKPAQHINEELFKNIKIDRKTQTYRTAIQLSRLILLNYSPDIAAGNDNVMAILFDMNKLFEEYIFRQLMKQKRYFPELKIRYQEEKRFWEHKLIRPDIVLSLGNKNIILDTKWKIMQQTPVDNDLKQMFIYNLYWQAKDAILLFPKSSNDLSHTKSAFFRECNWLQGIAHSVTLLPVAILKDEKLNTAIGRDILEFVLDKIKPQASCNP